MVKVNPTTGACQHQNCEEPAQWAVRTGPGTYGVMQFCPDHALADLHHLLTVSIHQSERLAHDARYWCAESQRLQATIDTLQGA